MALQVFVNRRDFFDTALGLKKTCGAIFVNTILDERNPVLVEINTSCNAWAHVANSHCSLSWGQSLCFLLGVFIFPLTVLIFPCNSPDLYFAAWRSSFFPLIVSSFPPQDLRGWGRIVLVLIVCSSRTSRGKGFQVTLISVKP